MRILILSIWLFSCTFAQRVSYDGYKVYRIYTNDEKQHSLLSHLQNSDNKLDFWVKSTGFGSPTDVMVEPRQQAEFVKLMKQYGMEPEVYIEDVQKTLSDEIVGKLAGNMTWTVYYELDDIYSWMDSLAQMYPENVTILSLGSSYEGRDLKGVKISFGPGRRAVLYEGTLHAREWITTATLTYLINELLTSEDPMFRTIAESFDWHIIPVVNPDGYVYSHKTNRMWRKTRTPYGSCYGADPNRNFDFYWGQFGASNDPCSDTYRGSRAFSEVETDSLRNYVTSVAPTLDMYLSFHSYGQLFLMPYGNTTDHLGNYDDLKSVATSGIRAIQSRYGTAYRTGNSAEILYYSSGTSKDWAKDKFNISIVYTVELRDTGRYGFVLPADQILPNNLEMMDGLVAMFQEGERLGYFTLG